MDEKPTFPSKNRKISKRIGTGDSETKPEKKLKKIVKSGKKKIKVVEPEPIKKVKSGKKKIKNAEAKPIKKVKSGKKKIKIIEPEPIEIMEPASSSESEIEENNEEIEEIESDFAIPEELRDLSMGEILKLRDEVGSATLDATLFPTINGATESTEYSNEEKIFRRENKKRPREMTTKFPVSSFRYVVDMSRKRGFDPRFEASCGDFDDHIFKQSYSFVDELRNEDRKKLETQLRGCRSEIKAEKLKHAIKSIKDKERTDKFQEKQQIKKAELRKFNLERINKGLKPQYSKPAESKREQREEKLDKLKKKGKLQQFLKKEEKKKSLKEDREMRNLFDYQ